MLCYVVCFIIGLFGVCLLVWVLIVGICGFVVTCTGLLEVACWLFTPGLWLFIVL